MKMLSIWKIIRSLLAISGFALMFLSVSTSDYYVLELGCAEPAYVGTYMLAGVLMLVTTVIHVLYELYLEGKREQ
jgi:uncharacterized membrane protein